MLEARDEQREQDRWLALARTGLAMMSSRNPRLAGAIGEAGLAGLEGFEGQNRQYTQDRFELLSALENARLQRAQLAARAAGGGGGVPGLTPNQRADTIEGIIGRLNERRATLLNPMTGAPFTQAEDTVQEIDREIGRLSGILNMMAGASFAPAPVADSAFDMGAALQQ
jgi:hypothetical protein